MRAFIFMIVLSSALAVGTAVSPAWAETPQCVPRAEFLKHLQNTFSEEPVALGMSDNGAVTELLHSKSGDSWTIIMTTPEGLSCRIAAGKYWQHLRKPGTTGISH